MSKKITGRDYRYLREDNWETIIFYEAKKRSKVKNIAYKLTAKHEKELVIRCNGASEWSGMKFCFDKVEGCMKRPWIPSLDRIDSSKGYVMGNVRILNCFENNMLGQFGSEVAITGTLAIIKSCMESCVE